MIKKKYFIALYIMIIHPFIQKSILAEIRIALHSSKPKSYAFAKKINSNSINTIAGIFDGDGLYDNKSNGDVSSYLMLNFLSTLQNQSSYSTNLTQALHDTFTKIDSFFLAKDYLCQGSTGTIVLITKTDVIIAYVGNSRCLVYKNDETFFETQPHTPLNPVEQERLDERLIRNAYLHGLIPLTRAFGYFIQGSPTPEKMNGLLSTPTIVSIPRTDCKRIIIGTNDFWNNVTQDSTKEFDSKTLKKQYTWLEAIDPRTNASDDLKAIVTSLTEPCINKKNLALVMIQFD